LDESEGKEGRGKDPVLSGTISHLPNVLGTWYGILWYMYAWTDLSLPPYPSTETVLIDDSGACMSQQGAPVCFLHGWRNRGKLQL